MASTAFPMWKAAVYAVPDETRRLRLPEPQGDLWEFEFPFTVLVLDDLVCHIECNDP